MALTSLGAAEQAATIKRLLLEGNAKIVDYVFIGLQHAIERKTASPEFLTAIFDDLQQYLTWEEFQFESKPAQAMLRADRSRALSIITSDPVWRFSNPSLVPILRALLKERVDIPPQALAQLDHELGEPNGDRRREEVIGLLLNAQARQRIRGVEARITRYLDAGSTLIQHYAAEAFAAINGVIDPLAHTSNLIDARGWDRMTEPQQFLHAVYGLEGEVNNGGFSQYFFNSAGDFWRTALAGLRAMNVNTTFELLQKAVDFFGPDGPSADRDERQEQLSKIIDEREADLHALDDEFFKDEDQRYVRLLLYAAKNAEHFH